MKMRWIQISDLHVGRGDSNVESAIASLVRHVADVDSEKPIDAVFLTGDLTQSGLEIEYRKLEDLLLGPLRRIEAFQDAQIFAVPGNHDLDCDASDPIRWEGLGESRQREFFSESPRGQHLRRHRARSFKAFEDFLTRTGVVGPHPSREVSRIFSVGERISLILTNTAFFCDKDFRDEGKIVPPMESIERRICEWKECRGAGGLLLVVGHHPISWFVDSKQQAFRTALLQNHAIYIHGHEHKVLAGFGTTGILSLGLGAAYQDSPHAKPDPIYKNSYATGLVDNDFHIRLSHWDCGNGRWVRTTELPADFSEVSSAVEGGYVFRILPAGGAAGEVRSEKPRPERRAPPQFTSLLLLDEASSDFWRQALINMRLVSCGDISEVQCDERSPGMMTFSTDSAEEVYLISARGSVLTRSDVERRNNDIDYRELRRCVIVTLGSVAEDGREAATRLKRVKPIELIDRGDLANRIAESYLERSALAAVQEMDGADVEVEVLVLKNTVRLLVAERSHRSRFVIKTPDGRTVPEHDESVAMLRSNNVRFMKASYGNVVGQCGDEAKSPAEFDEDGYLSSCRKEFNSVKYAALAAMGLRLSSLTLEELYVSANADVDEPKISEAALNRAVDDALQNIAVDPGMRAQLKSQLRSIAASRRAPGSGGLASEMYQRNEVLLVLGDPGSGKTLFVKNEILAYCRREKDLSWYGRHVPIYINLAEAVTIDAWKSEKSIFSVAAQLSARRSTALSALAVESLDQAGRAAYFFDGLDEIVSVEMRERVFQRIAACVERGRKTGVRVIITSRPAAIQMLDVPASLSTVTLRGLSESEMKTLAHRVLQMRVTESETAASEDVHPSGDDVKLVERLICDCRQMPGLRRIARNPLLFTLLIMVYANHGPLAAKRHRVYHNALQTLASARSRSKGQRVLSESDLRKRLGAVALSVFEDPAGTVPTWIGTTDCIAGVIRDEELVGEPGAESLVAEQYIQSVAEATGILVLHKSDDRTGGFITFMHYSFMEYYAAVGLLQRDDFIEEAIRRAPDVRWREVLLLFAGILGDHGDIAPYIKRLLESQSLVELITLEKFAFAVESALESEVPPERVVLDLLESATDSFDRIIAVDDEVRARVGELFSKVLEASSSEALTHFLVAGLVGGEAHRRGAFADIVGHVANRGDIDEACIDAFVELMKAELSEATPGICSALSRSRRLLDATKTEKHRGKALIDSYVEWGLSRTSQSRFYIVKLLNADPSLAKRAWGHLVTCIRDRHLHVSRLAAQAILRAGWTVSPENDDSARTLEFALRRFLEVGDEGDVGGIGCVCEWEDVRRLISSNEEGMKVYGMMLLPWVDDKEVGRYRTISDVLCGDYENSRVEAICLNVLRLSSSLRSSLRLADVDAICRRLESRYPQDVRMVAAKVLAQLDDSRARESLLEYLRVKETKEKARKDEFAVAIRGVADHAVVGGEMWGELESLLVRYATKKGKRDPWRLAVLLGAVSTSDASLSLSPRTVDVIRGVANSFRETEYLRGRAIVAFGWAAAPSWDSSSQIVKWVENPPAGTWSSVLEGASTYFYRCGKGFEQVRSVQQCIGRVREILVGRTAPSLLREMLDEDLKNIRRILFEIERMEQWYTEIARRQTVN